MSVKSECCSVWKCTITHLLNVDPHSTCYYSSLKIWLLRTSYVYCALQLWFTNGFVGYKGHILWFLKNRRYCCVSYQYNEYQFLSDALLLCSANLVQQSPVCNLLAAYIIYNIQAMPIGFVGQAVHYSLYCQPFRQLAWATGARPCHLMYHVDLSGF